MSSRIAVSASKLSRAVVDSQRSAGAVLMPKYDELLRTRRTDESRGITTTHRPTPQPSIANRTKPLMQGFHSSAPSQAPPAAHLDTTVLPPLHPVPVTSEDLPRMPLLPDNYGAYHASLSDAADLTARFRATIVATDPDNVVPGAPLAAVEGVTVDGVELKFAHQQPQQEIDADTDRSTFMFDMWRSMVDDVMSATNPSAQKKSN
ncbi:hypothetical protein AK830_g7522 [Neonectria ditissima]|uniref:Uncharacterized protein n=1 Tax=Neonectria ditissima TaxID=78410 RepID=A0A0P7BG31_9HYPO|nr:hypothetical protein AK830_g7522 [Neonectria ditissima]